MDSGIFGWFCSEYEAVATETPASFATAFNEGRASGRVFGEAFTKEALYGMCIELQDALELRKQLPLPGTKTLSFFP